jgi:hypothetical protein
MGRKVIVDPDGRGFMSVPEADGNKKDSGIECPACGKTNINEWEPGEYACLDCMCIFKKKGD